MTDEKLALTDILILQIYSILLYKILNDKKILLYHIITQFTFKKSLIEINTIILVYIISK